MTTQSFALRRGEPKRLKITYGLGYRNMRILLDEQLIGGIEDKKMLKPGVTMQLPDGSYLALSLQSSALSGEKLHILVNSRPVPGSPGDPSQGVTGASGAAGAVGILTLFAGMVGINPALVTNPSSRSAPLNTGPNAVYLLAGVIFLILAYFISKRSKIALGVAVALYALDTVLLFFALLGGAGFSLVSIVVHLVLLGAMASGFSAIDNANHEDYLATIPSTNQSASKFSAALGGEPLYKEKIQ